MSTDRTPWIRCGFPGSTEPMHGLGDLVRAMGGDETSFIGRVLELVPKAQDNPENIAALRRGWPRLVRAWELWMSMSPTPTCDELLATLNDDGSARIRPSDPEAIPGQIYTWRGQDEPRERFRVAAVGPRVVCLQSEHGHTLELVTFRELAAEYDLIEEALQA